MAVPKKRTSLKKKRVRQAVWINKTKIQAKYAFSLAKSLCNSSQKSFTI